MNNGVSWKQKNRPDLLLKSKMVSKHPGINYSRCRFCQCLNFHVLKTRPGIFKVIQVFLAGATQGLLLKYGHYQIGAIGFSYDVCFSTSFVCFVTSMVLLITYLNTGKSIKYWKVSLFESLFNTWACILYMTSGGYLAVSLLLFLWQMNLALLFFLVSPALTTCYGMCFLASIVHGMDALSSYMAYRRITNHKEPRNAV